MSLHPKLAQERFNKVLSAWENLRSEKAFAGVSLEQFKAAIQPSLTTRDRVIEARNNLTHAMRERASADNATGEMVQRIVAAVKFDPEEKGTDGLYAAMGFVPKAERRSGLTRRRTNPPSQAQEVAAK